MRRKTIIYLFYAEILSNKNHRSTGVNSQEIKTIYQSLLLATKQTYFFLFRKSQLKTILV